MSNLSIKDRIHTEIINEIDPRILNDRLYDRDRLKKTISSLLRAKLEQLDSLTREESDTLFEDLMNEIMEYGPITHLLEDESVTEVMVNGPNNIYYETKGRLHKSSVCFSDDRHVMRIIERIVAPIGRRIDESTPMVDARLSDGSRVNAIIPPLSLIGPCITIRKFSKDPFTIEDLVAFNTLTPEIANFLRACVEARLNIIISGGTGSGKSTTLNVMSGFIPSDERIVTIEDAAELQLRQEHVVSLESRPPNVEGRGGVTIRDLVRNCLRMRPDRIIVGEVRSGEALDMLQAMNTGHDGALTTCHSNSPRDSISRIETMVLLAGLDLPTRAIREQIASAVNLIIHQSRMRDGTRKITHITEVVGMEGQRVTLQDIFIYKQTGVDSEGMVQGIFEPTGIVPIFVDIIAAEGIELSREVFMRPDQFV